jgi:hypothetical protein
MPRPVSSTAMRSPADPEDPSSASKRKVTCPASVNFTAFPTRFIKIWRTRGPSPITRRLERRPVRQRSWMPLVTARGAMISATSSTSRTTSKASWWSSIWSASILEKSRRSLRRFRSASELARTLRKKSCCSGSRRVPRASSVMPRIALSGVRISWLMVARNAPLAWSAASAASLARSRAAAARRASVRSRYCHSVPASRPPSLRGR